MGSPSNSIEIFEIKESLIKVQQLYSNVIFLFICNNFQNIPNLKYQVIPWNESTFYSTINSFDIGIVPISHSANKHLKGKVAMKSLEMMVTGIPMVCSLFGVSDMLVNGENALIVEDEGEWEIKIIELIENEVLRKKIGISARETFDKYHSYNSQYQTIKKVLANV
jgi:glycosyltransferase involved in cell wall biosynthesis